MKNKIIELLASDGCSFALGIFFVSICVKYMLIGDFVEAGMAGIIAINDFKPVYINYLKAREKK